VYRTLWVALALVTVSFAGCQDTEPSRVIVSLQIDSDSEQTWIYLYTIPRVKMGNFTISLNDDAQTLTSVFSHQMNFSNDNIETDADGFSSLKVTADLSDVFWELSFKMKIITNLEDDSIYIDLLTINDIDDEVLKTEQLPYNVALEYSL
tara:strand:- start:277 stop:726 length:450 start_codon:yes stop_codon:yes gene_type:complete